MRLHQTILLFGLAALLLTSAAQAQSYLWSRGFGDSADQAGLATAVDAAGNIFLTGRFGGTVDFGAGPLTSAGLNDVFLARFDPNGTCLWSKRFGDNNDQIAYGVAVDPSGNVILTGQFVGSIDFGGGPLLAAGQSDIFLAKLDSNGNHIWSRRFGDANAQTAYAVATDASGDILLTGAFAGSVDFGAGPLFSSGQTDVFLVKFAPYGGLIWNKAFGDASAQVAYGVAADAAGDIFLTGQFDGSIDFGGGPLTSAGTEDIFLAGFSAAGSHLWSRRFGDAAAQSAFGVAVDHGSNVLITGQFAGTVDFGGGPLVSAGQTDVFLARFTQSGAPVWSKRFGDGGAQAGRAVATDGTGAVAITGGFAGTIDFGGGPLASSGQNDIFLARFDANGSYLLGRSFGDASDQLGLALATEGAGDIVFTGAFQGSVDFGGGPLTSGGGYDVFLARFGTDPASVPAGASAGTGTRLRFLGASVGEGEAPVRIHYWTGMAGVSVRLEILDLAGRGVYRSDLTSAAAGRQEFDWSGTGALGRALPGGIYFVRLDSGGEGASGKLVLAGR